MAIWRQRNRKLDSDWGAPSAGTLWIGKRAPMIPAIPEMPRYLRELAMRCSASGSIGPPRSAISRRISPRKAWRISFGSAASAWAAEAPPRS
jgi:hypothetical protein